MNKKIIDAKGKNCPIPLIMTRKAIKSGYDNFTVIVDNTIAKDNITRFLQDNKKSFYVDSNDFSFAINIGESEKISETTPKEELYCESSVNVEYSKSLICIKSDKMGEGDEEIGSILLRAFICTLKELSVLPKTLILYNSGIKLVLNDSPVLSVLRELEQKGVVILVCGACVDYYNNQKEISVGIISNMYEISEKLLLADKIIYP
jgi:selenium metabolism protein YedF